MKDYELKIFDPLIRLAKVDPYMRDAIVVQAEHLEQLRVLETGLGTRLPERTVGKLADRAFEQTVKLAKPTSEINLTELRAKFEIAGLAVKSSGATEINPCHIRNELGFYFDEHRGKDL